MKCVVELGETARKILIGVLNSCYALHPKMARFFACEKKLKLQIVSHSNAVTYKGSLFIIASFCQVSAIVKVSFSRYSHFSVSCMDCNPGSCHWSEHFSLFDFILSPQFGAYCSLFCD